MPIFNQVVKGSGGGSFIGIQKAIDANGKLVNGSQFIDLTGVTDIGAYALQYAYIDNTNLTGVVDFPNLQTVSGTYALNSMCRGSHITSVLLSSLETVTGNYAFSNAFWTSTLTSVDISSLRSVSATQAFNGAFRGTSITEIHFKSLESVTATSAFEVCCDGCTSLVTASFESLYDIRNYVFSRMFQSSKIKSIWFYALTPASGTYSSAFSYMLNSVTGCTVHFPIATQSTIGSWTDVTNGFNGTNTTVLFDLVTSLTGADTNTYTRSEKDSTATATAWKYNDVLYYTSGVSNHTAGVNEPTVGDTIYSDSACTTAVTTIGSIA